MTTFWLAAASLILLALLIVWRIFTTSKNAIGAENENIRQETNVTLYHEHLAQLEHDLAEGSIEQDSFEQLKAELDKTLLQDAQTDAVNNKTGQEKSLLWPIGIAVSIVALSSYTYVSLGAYQQISSPVVMANVDANSGLTTQQVLAERLQMLQQEVKSNPTNAQAWYSLGQAHIANGDFDNAVHAFDRVIEQAGEHAEILGPKAQAMYYKNNQQISPKIQTVIDKALALDPLDASTNILLGMDSFTRGKFADAVRFWEIVLNNSQSGLSNDALAGAIAEAKNQLAMASQSQAATPNDVTKGTVNNPQLAIEVSLTEEIKSALSGNLDKTVFVYAVATDGPRMPLAAVKVNVSDLPMRIVLDDDKAMTPQMRLSNFDRVNLYAVVSMQGNVGIKAGDFKAQLTNIDAMTKTPINLVISEKVQ